MLFRDRALGSHIVTKISLDIRTNCHVGIINMSDLFSYAERDIVHYVVVIKGIIANQRQFVGVMIERPKSPGDAKCSTDR